MEGCLARHLAAKRQKQTQETVDQHRPIEHAPRAVRRSPQVERLQQAYRAERQACYEQVVALRKLGMSQATIAERVGIGHSTVSRWLAASTLPETRRGPYVSRLDPYLPYLFQRWESGCHNMTVLFHELVARGYKGSYESVRDHLVRQLPGARRMHPKEPSSLPLLCPPGKRPSFSFLNLKNWRRKSKRRFASFAKAIQKQTWPMTSFNSLPRCCAHVQENSSTPGLRKSEPAKSANCKALFWVLNETKRPWWQASRFPKTTGWLRGK